MFKSQSKNCSYGFLVIGFTYIMVWLDVIIKLFSYFSRRKKSANIRSVKNFILSKKSMNLVHKLNMKKSFPENWVAILCLTIPCPIARPSHPTIEKMIFRTDHSACPNTQIRHERAETMRNAWKVQKKQSV